MPILQLVAELWKAWVKLPLAQFCRECNYYHLQFIVTLDMSDLKASVGGQNIQNSDFPSLEHILLKELNEWVVIDINRQCLLGYLAGF